MLKNMGGEGPGFAYRSRAGGFDILEHCHNLGFGAVRLMCPRAGPSPPPAPCRPHHCMIA